MDFFNRDYYKESCRKEVYRYKAWNLLIDAAVVTHIFTQNLNDTDVKCSDINSEITERNVSS